MAKERKCLTYDDTICTSILECLERLAEAIGEQCPGQLLLVSKFLKSFFLKNIKRVINLKWL